MDIIQTKLQQWQNQLLDVSKRNKLINYRDSKRSTLKLSSPTFYDLFYQLVEEAKTLTFQQPSQGTLDEQTRGFLDLLTELNHPLQDCKGDIGINQPFPETEKILKHLRANTKLFHEEKGTNPLFLSFGFLEWKNQENVVFQSPLLLVPATISAETIHGPYTLSCPSTEVILNPTLNYLLKTEFKRALPPLQLEKETISEYIHKLDAYAKGMGWLIRFDVTIDLLSYEKMSMYEDLSKNQEKIINHPLFTAMANPTPESSDLFHLPKELESLNLDQVTPDAAYQILMADSSQQNALLYAKHDMSFILQGPPGTGKSQTIANIIGEGLAQGKKILFVSEKAAALQIVYQRLKDANLSNFSLPLHENNTSTHQLLQELTANLMLTELEQETCSPEEMEKLSQLTHLREILTQYGQELHEKISPIDKSAYEIIGELTALLSYPSCAFAMENPLSLSGSQLQSYITHLQKYADALKEIEGNIENNPWNGLKNRQITTEYKTTMRQALESVYTPLKHSLEKLENTEPPLQEEMTLDTLSSYKSILETFSNFAPIPEKWLEDYQKLPITQLVTLGESMKEEYHDLVWQREVLERTFLPDIFQFDYKEWQEIVYDIEARLGETYLLEMPQPGAILEKCNEFKENFSTLYQSFTEINTLFTKINKVLFSHLAPSLDNTKILYGILETLRPNLSIEKPWFQLDESDPISLLEERKVLSQAFNQSKGQIQKNWEKTIFSVDYPKITQRFKVEYTSEFLDLLEQYQKDLDTLLPLSKKSRKHLTAPLVLKSFEEKLEYQKGLEQLDEGTQLREENEAYIEEFEILTADIEAEKDNIYHDWKEIVLEPDFVEKTTNFVRNYRHSRLIHHWFSQGNFQSLLPDLSQPITPIGPDAFQKEWNLTILDLDYLQIAENFKEKYTPAFHSTMEAYIKDWKLLKSFYKGEHGDFLYQFIRDSLMQKEHYNENTSFLEENHDKYLAQFQITEEYQNLQAELEDNSQELRNTWTEQIFITDTKAMLENFSEQEGTLKFMNKAFWDNKKKLQEFIQDETVKVTSELAVSTLEQLEQVEKLKNQLAESKKSNETAQEFVDLYHGIQTTLEGTPSEIFKCWKEEFLQEDFGEIGFRYQTQYTTPFRNAYTTYTADIKTLKNYAIDSNWNIGFTEAEKVIDQLMIFHGVPYLCHVEMEELLTESYLGSQPLSYVIFQNLSKQQRYIREKEDEILEKELHISEKQQDVKKKTRLDERISIIKSNLDAVWEDGFFAESFHEIAKRYQNQYDDSFQITYGAYQADMKVLQAHIKEFDQQVSHTHATELLSNLSIYHDNLSWFQEHQDKLKDVAITFTGEEHAEWDQLLARLHVVSKIKRFFKDEIPEEFLEIVTTDYKEQCIALEASINRLDFLFKDIMFRLLKSGINIQLEDSLFSFDDVKNRIYIADELCTQLQEQLQQIRELCFSQKTDIPAILEAFKVLESYQEMLPPIHEKTPFLKEHFHELFQGEETPWEEIIALLHALEKSKTNPYFISLVPVLKKEKEMQTKILEPLVSLVEMTQERKHHFIWLNDQFSHEFSSLSLCQVEQKVGECLEKLDLLEPWVNYQEVMRDCHNVGLQEFIQTLAENGHNEEIEKIFLRRFYQLCLEEACTSKDQLRKFRRTTHDQVVEDYRNLDEAQCQIAQRRIRDKLIESLPNREVLSEEMGILSSELEKEQHFISLSLLFKKIPKLLLNLKPCFLMSPLSVSHYLDMSLYQFDMVIFDEASQITTEDAIGAMVRGKQLIIAGDMKQLPPSRFFNVTAPSTTFQMEEESEENSLSILEEGLKIFPCRTLRWHYRSKHEDLIRFSNENIYQNSIITFPTPASQETDMGLEWVYVPDGVYERNGKNYNLNEARKCTELLKKHIEETPHRSLGMIAFSEKQQSAIEMCIEAFRETNPQYEFFFNEKKDEPFFVKNLENVQGDQRDSIIFSICYAKQEGQEKMSMRFGPLGQVGGEYRLNVAITRAKYNIKLVTSIQPEEIDLSRSNAKGVHLLRAYLEYVQSVSKQKIQLISSNTTSDLFVKEISQFIENNGYSVINSIGYSDCKIDIVVSDPASPEISNVAIQCDGTHYRKPKTTRDRDHLQGKVLQEMGWKKYRIWSTEWVRNPEVEGKSLIQFLSDSYPEPKKELSMDEDHFMITVDAAIDVDTDSDKYEIIQNVENEQEKDTFTVEENTANLEKINDESLIEEDEKAEN